MPTDRQLKTAEKIASLINAGKTDEAKKLLDESWLLPIPTREYFNNKLKKPSILEEAQKIMGGTIIHD